MSPACRRGRIRFPRSWPHRRPPHTALLGKVIRVTSLLLQVIGVPLAVVLIVVLARPINRLTARAGMASARREALGRGWIRVCVRGRYEESVYGSWVKARLLIDRPMVEWSSVSAAPELVDWRELRPATGGEARRLGPDWVIVPVRIDGLDLDLAFWAPFESWVREIVAGMRT